MALSGGPKAVVLGLGGEVVAEMEVSPLETVAGLKRAMGFPPTALRLFAGAEELADDHVFGNEEGELLLSRVVVPVEPTGEALGEAAGRGYAGLVRTILQDANAGRELLSFRGSQSTFGGTALHQACYQGQLEVMELLLAKAEEWGVAEAQLLAGLRGNLENVLHLAVVSLHVGVVRRLFTAAKQCGCCQRLLLQGDVGGYTPLHAAMDCDGHQERLAIIDELLAAAQEADAADDLLLAADEAGTTALHLACLMGEAHVARRLLSSATAGGRRRLLQARNEEGRTPREEAQLNPAGSRIVEEVLRAFEDASEG